MDLVILLFYVVVSLFVSSIDVHILLMFSLVFPCCFFEWSSLFCSLTSVIVFFVSLVCHGLLCLTCELFVVVSVDFLFASVFVPLLVGPLNVC